MGEEGGGRKQELTHGRSYERWTSVYERLGKKFWVWMEAKRRLQQLPGGAGDGLRRFGWVLVQAVMAILMIYYLFEHRHDFGR